MYSLPDCHWLHFETVSMASHKHVLPPQPKPEDLHSHLLFTELHPKETHHRQASATLTAKAGILGETPESSRELRGSLRPQWETHWCVHGLAWDSFTVHPNPEL